MKIGIISDTHRNIKSIDKAIPYLKECDLIIHAGDNIDDAEYIYYATDVLVKCVKGNCDLYNIDEPYELTFLVKDKKFFLCHGHQYDVKWGFDSLLKIAKDNNYGRVEWWCLDWNKSSIEFYKKMGAVPMDEWTVFRVTGENLDKLAGEF